MENYIILILLSYLIGNFSTSYIVGKLSAKIDIRDYGSGNAGSTNVLRTLGLKAAGLTFLGDLLKGIIAVYLGKRYGGENMGLICGVFVVLGHNWPVLFKFRGGKGIATSIGVVLFIQPFIAITCFAVGIIVLLKFKYVSLASITAMALLPFFILIYGLKYFLFGLILSGLAIYRHSDNIERLLSGTERKIKASKKESLE